MTFPLTIFRIFPRTLTEPPIEKNEASPKACLILRESKAELISEYQPHSGGPMR